MPKKTLEQYKKENRELRKALRMVGPLLEVVADTHSKQVDQLYGQIRWLDPDYMNYAKGC